MIHLRVLAFAPHALCSHVPPTAATLPITVGLESSLLVKTRRLQRSPPSRTACRHTDGQRLRDLWGDGKRPMRPQQIDHSFHIASDCGLDGFTIVALPRADQISIAPAQCLAERRQPLQSPLPADRLALTGRGSNPLVFSHDGAAACYARWRGRRPRSPADERYARLMQPGLRTLCASRRRRRIGHKFRARRPKHALNTSRRYRP